MSSTLEAPPRVRAAHATDSQDVLRAVDSSMDGLAGEDARRRLDAHGPNTPPQAQPLPAWRVLAGQVADPMIVVLLVSGVIAAALGEAVDAAVVFAVVAVNALIGFAQEQRADHAIRALSAMVPEHATVIRDGRRTQVPAADVVPGDVVVLARGDRVPADLRILDAHGLDVDESALTGESLPVPKTTDAVPAATPVADRGGIAHGGTIVVGGRGRGVVIATGAHSELGRIAAMVHAAAPMQTPLTQALSRFARLMAGAVTAIAALMLTVALLRGYPLADAFLAAISLAVAAIPEGLPAIVTIALAVGVRRMARRGAVVRRLPAVETLGSTTVVCTDKTGTLTRNEMTVTALWTAANSDEEQLLRAAVLCSDGSSPTERALIDAAAARGLDPVAIRDALPRTATLPFEPEYKLMATRHADGAVYVKGASDAVLDRCRGPEIATARHVMQQLAASGIRVLAVAVGASSGHLGLDELEELTLLGLTGISDPLREDAADAVAACRAAGMHVKVITGDHAATAGAIGRQLGLDADATLTAADLDALDDTALAAAAPAATIFARVTPEHKLRLVRALQAQQHVVAMTGDGVNDAPALRQADIGVAMGVTGTAVAREAADIVLADDRFATVAAAVEEGRRVFDNLQKAIAFVLPTNLGEALILLVAVLAFPFSDSEPLLPVSPTQILWVNLIATITLALPLAMERAERDVMQRPPRPPASPVVSRLLIGRTVLVSLLMTAAALILFLVHHADLKADGVGAARALAEAQTLVVTTIVVFQVVYLLQCRSLRRSALDAGLFANAWAWAGIAAILVLQSAFIYLPPLQDTFGTAPLDLSEWLLAGLAAAVLVPAVALEEALRRRLAPPGTA